jgi:HTH-type transcriptional regulator/antitoxin HigA
VPNYNSRQLKKLASQIPEFSLKKNGIKKFIDELKLAGVKFLFLQHLEKTYTDGAAFYSGKNPAIIYTARYNRDDNFWFTIIHEIGHILKHLSKEKKEFIDCLDNIDQTNSFEKEANNYAENILKAEEIINYFRNSQRITKTKIRSCSEKLKISRRIIVGVLHYNKTLPYSSMREIFSEVIEK